jgi:divalent metal cation (Fe/Co/Zn/Cd) transporter
VIDTAFLLPLAGIAFGAVGVVLNTLADREHLTRLIGSTLSGTGRAFTEDDVLRLVGPFRAAGGVLVAVLVAVLLLTAVRMRAGRNWARLLLTAAALLGMVNFLSSVLVSGAALALTWNLAGVAFTVAAVIYLFRPEAAEFFADRTKRR